MPKIIISIEGVVIKEAQLTSERTSLGRRPYNDVVIDNLAVSGEHAVLQMIGSEVFLEDLNSTNGTYVNGKAVKKQLLQHNDTVEIGKYKLKFVNGPGSVNVADTAFGEARTEQSGLGGEPQPAENQPLAAIKVLTGAAAGREVPLVKAVTTIGKPGVAVAAISRRLDGFSVTGLEGGADALLNGAPLGSGLMELKSGDVLELAGTQMQFMQRG